MTSGVSKLRQPGEDDAQEHFANTAFLCPLSLFCQPGRCSRKTGGLAYLGAFLQVGSLCSSLPKTQVCPTKKSFLRKQKLQRKKNIKIFCCHFRVHRNIEELIIMIFNYRQVCKLGVPEIFF